MKPSLLLLHGAIGSSAQLKNIADKLSGRFDVHLFDFPGHGGKALPATPFSISLFTDAVLRYIQSNELAQPSIFGYSMGGYIAMLLAKENPTLIKKIITLGTKFYWNEAVAAKEVKMLNAATIELKVPAFAAALQKMHAPEDWKQILERTVAMLTDIGKDSPLKDADYAAINTPSLLLLGEKDQMVSLEETEKVFAKLPHAKMMVLADTPHVIAQVDAELVAGKIGDFFSA